MYINNKDSDFLIKLENKLMQDENYKKEFEQLWQLNKKLLQQKKVYNEKTRQAVAEKRKLDKNYARPYTVKQRGANTIDA